MARKPKLKPVQTEAQKFSAALIQTCDRLGTKTVAEAFGVTVRSVQVWKNDASKVNNITRKGGYTIMNEISFIIKQTQNA